MLASPGPVRFRVVDTEGNEVGELSDAEATWGLGDMVSVNGQDFKIVETGRRTVAEHAAAAGANVPVLIVRRP